jgi:hypothetical protein
MSHEITFDEISSHNLLGVMYNALNLQELDYGLRMQSVRTAVPLSQELLHMAARADLETVGETTEVLDSDHVASSLGHGRHEGSQAVAESSGPRIQLDSRAGQNNT